MPKLGFLTNALPSAKLAVRSGVSRPKGSAVTAAASQAADESFSAEEMAFLNGLAKHREAFSAEAVIARAKKHQ